MSIKHPEQRVCLFIDAQNLYHSAKNLYGAKVNFRELLKAAVGGRKLVRAIAYVIGTESGEERAFFDALEKSGIEIKVKDLQIFPGGEKKGDWDVGLAIDAVRLSSSVDAVIIASGDGDFIPLVSYLQALRGMRVEIVAFQKSASSRLIEVADEFIDLSKNSKYLIKKY